MCDKKLRCVANCPELDEDNVGHCVVIERELNNLDSDYCMCGNVPKWEPINDNDNE